MVWLALLLLVATWVVLFKTPLAFGSARSASTRAADTVGISVYGVRYSRSRCPASSRPWAARTSRSGSSTPSRRT